MPRRNPATAAAAELSEEFHGRPAHTITDVDGWINYRRTLTDLGGMEELVLVTPDGHEVELRFGHDVRLASSPDGGQLFLVAGDQELDLSRFPGIDQTKDTILLGQAVSIVYYTAKHHLRRRDRMGGPYSHEFGEDEKPRRRAQARPSMLYDRLNRRILFAGGNYRVEDRGIVN